MTAKIAGNSAQALRRLAHPQLQALIREKQLGWGCV
jgi:hypothetical protein